VFQSYALWPHMNVLDTVMYPFMRHGVGERDARQRALKLLERVGLAEFAGRQPGQLSGGQQQRVGLLRALAVEPDLFLFDEPTANLDLSLRATLQAELRDNQQAVGAAGLYVTHDPTEALAVADQVAILRAGRLVQQDVPERVYRCPTDEGVAILTGAATMLDGEILGPDVVAFAGVARVCCTIHAAQPPAPGPYRLCARPEWVRIVSASDVDVDGLDSPARIVGVRFQGPHTDYTLATRAGPILARCGGVPRYALGDAVQWTLTAVSPV
jgi:iron(III) transport system ATP-binding protein